MTRRTEDCVPGFGVEGQWAMEALRTIVELGKTDQLKDDPFYAECPRLSVADAELFGDLMEQGKVKINLRPFGSSSLITHQLDAIEGQAFFRINMRPDVAAVVCGVAGFDSCVYKSQNRSLVGIVKAISKEGRKLLPRDSK